MQAATFILLAAIFVVALAEGQYYVPRAYYTIDSEGHPSAPVALRRLRRSLSPYPYAGYGGGGASANANANAEAYADGWGGANANANANAVARANGGGGGWGIPSSMGYGASNPTASLRH